MELINFGESRLILSKESSSEQIRAYFEAVCKLYQSNEKFPVDIDDVWMLVYKERGDAVKALRKRFYENEDFITVGQNPNGRVNGKFAKTDYRLTVN